MCISIWSGSNIQYGRHDFFPKWPREGLHRNLDGHSLVTHLQMARSPS